ncbi:MAG: aminotransferase class IV [Deltaproteobacteria bacterium]|jgi:branched-chain amino acid aminotransferase|nr:aminotransferase class IV [Deltaproteobacteria bacterium]
MTQPRPVLTPENFIEHSRAWRRDHHRNYFVMYSSVWRAFSTSPELWALPPDDHMTHRGDGVFEAFKCVGGRAYCLNEHLERLRESADALGIALPPDYAETLPLLRQAYRLGGSADFMGRICVSRGPGSFTVNPYDSAGPEYYFVTIRLPRPSPEAYARGAAVRTTPFPAQGEFAGIKSCNYLHNVLVKKFARDSGADYAVSFDAEGFLAEASSENVVLVTRAGELVCPPWKRVLKGVTLTRALAIAEGLVSRGTLKSAGNRDISREELWDVMAEAFLTTTSLDVMPITSWDGRPVGDGRPGPVARELRELIIAEYSADGPFATRLGD